MDVSITTFCLGKWLMDEHYNLHRLSTCMPYSFQVMHKNGVSGPECKNVPYPGIQVHVSCIQLRPRKETFTSTTVEHIPFRRIRFICSNSARFMCSNFLTHAATQSCCMGEEEGTKKSKTAPSQLILSKILVCKHLHCYTAVPM